MFLTRTVYHCVCIYYCGVLSSPFKLIYRKFKFLCKAQQIDNSNLLTCLPLNNGMSEWIYKFGNGTNLSFEKLREELTHLSYLEITTGFLN